MVVNMGDDGYYSIGFGYPRSASGWYGSASLVRYRAGKRETLDEDDDTPLKIGKKYTVQLNVSKRSISASANGRTFLKAKNDGGSYGQFGFRGCPNVSELYINGQANTAWLEGLADGHYQEAWDAFDDLYEPTHDHTS